MIRRFDWISVLVRAVALALMVWLGGSLATAQTPGSAAPSTASETDRLAALEKSSAEQTAAIAAAQSAGDNSWMLVSSALFR